MKKYLILLLILFSIGYSHDEYKNKYREQTEINVVIDEKLTKCKSDKTEQKLKCENKIQKLKSKKNYIVRIPFTNIGITNHHVQGAVFVLIIILL